MHDKKGDDGFATKHRQNEVFNHAKTGIKLLLPRRWLGIGEHLGADRVLSCSEFLHASRTKGNSVACQSGSGGLKMVVSLGLVGQQFP
jgi:hypothetical protein